MRLSIHVIAFVACISYGCGDSKSSVQPAAPTPVTSSPSPPSPPASGNGINGRYLGDLTFTEENTSYGWPPHLTVAANLLQDGARVTGVFDLIEVD